MSRFLFVVPPLVGHINPTVGVATALVDNGHEVAWAGNPEIIASLVGPNAAVFPCATPELGDGRTPDMRGPAALKFLWESFLIPLAEAMTPGVRNAVDEFAPDALIVDQQAIAGGMVANALDLPWATSATTSAELADPLASMPRVAEWLAGMLADLQARLGMPPVGDIRFSPHLVLVFSTIALTGLVDYRAGQLRFVGPSIAARPPADDFPWDWLDPQRQHVLISLGTANIDVGAQFLSESARALAERPHIQGIIVDPAGTIGETPENVLVCRRVPQLELMPRVQAVVCHGGHNTVCEALYHGVPLVIAPIRDDQPIVAQQVVDADAGVRLRFGRANADQIGAAIDKVLSTAFYWYNARRVRDSFRSAGGAAAAAGHLAELARTAEVPRYV